MTDRRAVITGLGLLSPIGTTPDSAWARVLRGETSARKVDTFDTADLACKVVCYLPRIGEPDGFNPEDVMTAREIRRVDGFVTYAVAAAQQALDDAGWKDDTDPSGERSGVMVTSGVGGLQSIVELHNAVEHKGPRRVSPFLIPAVLLNSATSAISIRWGLRGPNASHVGACASSAQSIGAAAQAIVADEADMVLAGGAENTICRACFAGFIATRAMSTGFNDDPGASSRPFDAKRDGFVMAEGAGVMVVEERNHALARGARIYAEVAGYGNTADAHHITAPDPTGRGARKAVELAMKRAGVSPHDIGYVNAHATSTPAGDVAETRALEAALGASAKGMPTSSVKGSLGHMLGAAGVAESIMTVLALRDNLAPPNARLEHSDIDTPLDLVAGDARAIDPDTKAAICNSFGFGGVNASLIFARP